MFKSIQPILLATIISSVSFEGAVDQVAGNSESKTQNANLERILQSVASGSKLEADASDHVLALIAIVEDGKHQESDLAIRALTTLKSKASPAIAAMCKKLSDPDHATRAAAVDALVAIGDDAVVRLREILSFPAARTRAAATQALARVKRLDLDSALRLSNDPDPRVRAAAVDALTSLGKPSVPRLAEMLLDPELAVAVEAARALKSNRAHAPLAIPRLTQAVSRKHLSADAGLALSAYGIAAQRAVPALIRADLEPALEHIGPPSVLDIPQLCDSLMDANVKIRIVAAKYLALLGPDGKQASEALEVAANKSIREYVTRKRNGKSNSRSPFDNSGRLFAAGENCAAAVWAVTHDTPRFLNLVEKLAIAADSPLSWSRSTDWHDISADDCRLFEVLLRHSDHNVRETALNVLSDVGPGALPLKTVLIQIAQDPDAVLSQKAVATLAAIGPFASVDVVPVLISALRRRAISLQQFADATGNLRIRSETTQAILEAGLRDKDRWAAAACANALCITSNESSRIARLVIDAARDEVFSNRDAVEALTGLKHADDVVLPFLVAQLKSKDYWTRHDALNAIGSFREKASSTIVSLEKLLNDESPLIRLKAAKAIFLVAGNPIDLEKQLELALASNEPYDCHNALETIAELNRSDARFTRYALAELRQSPPNDPETAIKALQAIATEEALAALRATAESSDWILRSQAREALRQVEHPDGKKGN